MEEASGTLIKRDASVRRHVRSTLYGSNHVSDGKETFCLLGIGKPNPAFANKTGRLLRPSPET